MTDLAALVEFLQTCIADTETEIGYTQAEIRPPLGERSLTYRMLDLLLIECKAKRDRIEWALGIEAMRDLDDPRVPEDFDGHIGVLKIDAEVYAARPGYR